MRKLEIIPASATNASLPEVHASVLTTHTSPWRRMLAFTGPAYLVSVGYMDPGNWATDLEGGARFGYDLLWVLVLSNMMAILLQTLAARLGIASGRDLAQACREAYPRPIAYVLWFLCEIAIAACDLAEVLGAAIALNLLFHIPLLLGVMLTAADTLLVLWFTRRGIRFIESFVLALIAVIAVCFFIEIFWAGVAPGQLVRGLVPRLTDKSLYVAIGILGATVMPHNLYLHSALVQTRRIGIGDDDKSAACRYNLIDSVVALNAAMFVNIAILVLAASVFFTRHVVVTEIQQAHVLLTPMMGTVAASVLFAIALLCSGQSSTLTGTMAGQVIMEGFLSFRMRPWLRRLITRMAAITPAALTIYFVGDKGTYHLLILSQVILSLQLPFAVIPLIHFTSSRERMGKLANKAWVQVVAWLIAALILGLNCRLAALAIRDWLSGAGSSQVWLKLIIFPAVTGLVVLLVWIIIEPAFPYWRRTLARKAIELPPTETLHFPAHAYRSILVPLDHSAVDSEAIAHAAAMSRLHHAKVILLHVEEDVTSLMYGPLSSTAEVTAGEKYLDEIMQFLEAQGVEVEKVVRHARDPKTEIVRFAREIGPDLIVMGAHGHKGLKDLIFGTTINAVRHSVKIPLLIVRPE